MKKRVMSLLLCLALALTLLPMSVFAEGGTTQKGKATLIGFAAGRKAGDAYIRNEDMTILDAAGVADGNNPNTTYGTVGQEAVLSPYTPTTVSKYNQGYEYNDYSATAIIVQNADENGTGSQRRLRKVDTFKPGMTYRFTFQDTSWPVNSTVKGGGYLGELTRDNFSIRGSGYGASVVKVERIAQQVNETSDSSRDMQGFFYNVWIKIDGSEKSYSVGLGENVTAVKGLSGGLATEGTEVKLTAQKMKDGELFTGWSVTADSTSYTDALDISYYCNLKQFTRGDTSDDKVYCSFLMGDKSIRVEAVYAEPGTSGTGDVTFSSVKLWVTPPVNGGKAVAAAVPEFDRLGEAYQINKVEWLEDQPDGGYNYLHTAPSKTFDPSKCYTMRVLLKLNDGYAFTDKDGVNITINGQEYGTNGYTLYNNERRWIPVSYDYDATGKALAIYIPADGQNTWLTTYKSQAALTFTDGQDVARIESIEAYRTGETTATASATTSGKTLELAAGKYTVKVNVWVSETMQKLMAGYTNKGGRLNGTPVGGRSNGNPVTLDAAVLGLMNPSALTGQTPFGSGIKNSDGTYTYTSETLTVDSGEKYLLAAALNLKAKPLIPQFELNYPDEMLITSKNLTASATIEGTAAKVISGSITYTSAVRYNGLVQTGTVVKADGENVPDTGYTYQWQRNDGSGWTDIAGATGKQYTPVAEDVGKEIRLVINGTNGYTGTIVGGAKKVEKAAWTGMPVAPRLDWSAEESSKVTVSDSKANQEYLVTYSSDVPTIGTWVPGNGSTLTLDAIPNTTVYVFTRFRADNTHEVGANYIYGFIYTGNVTEVKNIVLDKQTIDLGYGESTAITVKPIPENATDWNEKSINWSVADPTNSGIKLYSDQECNTELTKDTHGIYEAVTNKTVYVKGGNQVSHADVKAQLTLGATDIRVATCTLNVAGEDGSYKLSSVRFYPGTKLTVAPGETVTIDYTADPVNATLVGTTWKLRTDSVDGDESAMGSGEFSITANTITIKIPIDRADGTYYYAADFTLDASLRPFVCVEVTKPNISLELFTLTPKTLTLNVNDTFTLSAVKQPVNAPGDISWTVTGDESAIEFNQSTQTVTAKRAGTATIKATCGSFEKSCVVTVIDPAHEHNVTSWSNFSESQHFGLCGTCGAVQYAPHAWTKSGTGSYGSCDYVRYNCTDCGAEKMELTARPDPTYPVYPVTPSKPAEPEKPDDGKHPFTDVKPGSYYEDAVIWAVGKGITGGTSATTFAPNAACNRAQAVTFLWRAAGSPAPRSTTMPFTDVPSGSYYYDAVLWAVENGVTNGTSATTFSPNASCNRAQIVTFLWRAQKSPAATAANPFTDVAADAYYTSAVLWAVKEGVTAGTTATTFSPAADCTRAQIVTFIYRALAKA